MAVQYPVDIAHGNAVVLSGLLTFTDPSVQPSASSTYNVVTYGAKGDGQANDTAAIQAALNACLAGGGGVVFFPPGTFNVTGLSVTLGTNRMSVVGSGQASKIVNISTGAGSTAKCSLYVLGDAQNVGTDWIEIRDLELIGGSVGGAGIYLDSCFQGVIANVKASAFTSSGWNIGIYLHNSIDFVIVNPLLIGNGTGLKIDGSFGNANCVIGGWIYNNTNFGVNISGVARGNTFYNTILQQNGVSLLSTGANAQGTSMFGGWVENDSTGTNVGLEVNSPGFLAEGVVLVRHLTTVKIDAGASNVVIRSPYALTNAEKMSVALGATNVTLWDATGTVTVTDNSGGQYKAIRSYLLTGG